MNINSRVYSDDLSGDFVYLPSGWANTSMDPVNEVVTGPGPTRFKNTGPGGRWYSPSKPGSYYKSLLKAVVGVIGEAGDLRLMERVTVPPSASYLTPRWRVIA